MKETKIRDNGKEMQLVQVYNGNCKLWIQIILPPLTGKDEEDIAIEDFKARVDRSNKEVSVAYMQTIVQWDMSPDDIQAVVDDRKRKLLAALDINPVLNITDYWVIGHGISEFDCLMTEKEREFLNAADT